MSHFIKNKYLTIFNDSDNCEENLRMVEEQIFNLDQKYRDIPCCLLWIFLKYDDLYWDLNFEYAKESFYCWFLTSGVKEDRFISQKHQNICLEYLQNNFKASVSVLEISKYNFLYLIDIFELENLPYFADSGTLLGTLRHKGIIPWDSDVDIGLEVKYIDQLFAICEKYNLKVRVRQSRLDRQRNGLIIDEKSQFEMSKETLDLASIEINLYEYSSNKYNFYNIGKNGYFKVFDTFRNFNKGKTNLKEMWLYPLRKADFYNKKVNIPFSSETLVKNQYGRHCMVTYPKHMGKINSSHDWANKMESSKNLIKDFSPL